MSEGIELPSGWCRSAIANVCHNVVGFAFKSNEFAGEGIRLLRGENIEPGALRWSDTRYWPPEKSEQFRHLMVSDGDIILAMDRPIVSAGLKLARASARDVPCLLVQRVTRIRPHADLCSSFVYFGLQSSGFAQHLLKGQTGTQLPHVSSKSISAFELPLAPLNEQRRIVAKIEELYSDLDAGVVALERAKANLKRYRAAVLKAAVEGKLTEQWRTEHPHTEPASKLLTRILIERRQKWEADQLAKFAAAGKEPPKSWREKYVEPSSPETSGLPELPDGWCWASVEQCALDVTVGHVGPMKDRYTSDGIPFLRSQNVRPLRFDRDGLRFIPDDFHSELSKSRLYGGELLVVRSGNIGDACVYPGDEPEANCADLVITRLVNEVNPHYAATFVVSPLGLRLVGGKRTGSALSHFNVGAMAKGPLPLPPVAEQKVIVAEVAEKLSQIDAAETAIDRGLLRAARLRQSILKQAFEGKLVPQDPHDEPARALLDRLCASRSDHNGNRRLEAPAISRNIRENAKRQNDKGCA